MESYGILGWIVIGGLAGALAKLLMPGRDPGGIIVTMVLGIVGALLGGFVGRALGMYNANESAGFIMALIGAVSVLLIYRLSIGNRHRTVAREFAPPIGERMARRDPFDTRRQRGIFMRADRNGLRDREVRRARKRRRHGRRRLADRDDVEAAPREHAGNLLIAQRTRDDTIGGHRVDAGADNRIEI